MGSRELCVHSSVGIYKTKNSKVNKQNFCFFLKRHAEMSPRPSPSPSLAEEPMSSMFYYQSGSSEENCFSCYAGLDEEMFYNAKYESIHDEPPYNNSSIYYTGKFGIDFIDTIFCRYVYPILLLDGNWKLNTVRYHDHEFLINLKMK